MIDLDKIRPLGENEPMSWVSELADEYDALEQKAPAYWQLLKRSLTENILHFQGRFSNARRTSVSTHKGGTEDFNIEAVDLASKKSRFLHISYREADYGVRPPSIEVKCEPNIHSYTFALSREGEIYLSRDRSIKDGFSFNGGGGLGVKDACRDMLEPFLFGTSAGD